VNAAIIKLDALGDAIRPAAENHHLLRRVAFGLIAAAIAGGMILRRVGFKFSGTGVHEPVARNDFACRVSSDASPVPAVAR
jgi:hypothetical protein